MSSAALANHRNTELKKHVNAIHCSNNLTLVQRKLFNALLFNAYPELPHKQRFEIRGKDLCCLIGYNSKDTGKLKQALLGLITIAIEWNVIDCATGQEKKWKASSILASAELSNGVCVYEYSQVMKELLYQPEIYGRINIEIMSRFKSSYGLALYENCIRYKGLAQTPWFPLEMFRKLMGVFDNKYLAFKDFKKRVLDIAVREVNETSPIKITPEIERVNQKVTKLRFKLTKNLQSDNFMLTAHVVDEELNALLKDTFGFSQQMIEETTKKYESQYIKEKIEIIMQSESFIAGKIRGLAGYLIEALKKDYKLSKSSKAVVEEKRRLREAMEQEKLRKEKSREERYNRYTTKKIDTFIANLDEQEKRKLDDDFATYIKKQNTIFQGWYRKHGLEHPATNASFKHFVKETRKERLGELLSLEDFITLIDENN
ncbi:MAG: replication initiation protein [Legionellales bacterium]|nr:replication initiation protein [Legionellales bacterium]